MSDGGQQHDWLLRYDTHTSEQPERWCEVTLVAHDGRVWSTRSSDYFHALQLLRRQVEPDARIGCNGARLNAWASGMQRDMGLARSVYLVAMGDSGRPPQVPVFGPAPLSDVSTVAEQDEFIEQWIRSRSAREGLR